MSGRDQARLTRTLLGPNHASLSVLIRKYKCRSMARRPRIISSTSRSFVRARGWGRV
jgi:hypothetical protein